MFKIKIFGAGNCGNVGDDLIAYILEKYVEKNSHRKVDVSLIEQQKQYDEIPEADILIIGGGGLIYDYDMSNVLNYCNAIHLANNYRIPVFFMGMGVQHVFSQEAKDEYKKALPFVTAMAVRGEEDARFIQTELNYPEDRIVISRDIVFLHDDVCGRVEKRRSEKGSEKPVLALSLADWKLGESFNTIEPRLADTYKKYREYIYEKLPKLKETFTVKVVCQASEDKEVANEIAELTGGEVYTFPAVESSSEIVQLYADADFVITNRYHGLIAAIIADTPVISASFSTHKSQRLIKDSFKSLTNQFYTIEEFTNQDILSNMCDNSYTDGLVSARRSEYRKCVKLAQKHNKIMRYIANELSKIEVQGRP